MIPDSCHPHGPKSVDEIVYELLQNVDSDDYSKIEVLYVPHLTIFQNYHDDNTNNFSYYGIMYDLKNELNLAFLKEFLEKYEKLFKLA